MKLEIPRELYNKIHTLILQDIVDFDDRICACDKESELFSILVEMQNEVMAIRKDLENCSELD